MRTTPKMRWSVSDAAVGTLFLVAIALKDDDAPWDAEREGRHSKAGRHAASASKAPSDADRPEQDRARRPSRGKKPLR